jgi:hypothetical protein
LPDKFTSKSRSFDRNSYGEKDRELPKAAKGFFLVQGIAVERQGLCVRRGIWKTSSPELKPTEDTKVENIFYCSSVFGQPDM